MRKLMLAVCLLGAMAIMAAQQPQPSQAFEVASVKPNKSGDGRQFIQRMPGGRITITNMAPRLLVALAYQLAQFQLVGGPPWMNTDHFDVVAKMEGDPPPAPPGSASDPMLLSLQALLADRFKLKIHRETREMDIYALVVAKPGTLGPGLKPSTTDCMALAAARRGRPPGPPGPPPPGEPFCGMMAFPGQSRFGGLPITQLMQMLGAQTGRMVVDRTGLTGNWDFTLTFAAEQRGQPPPGVNFPAVDPDAPSIFTALQEQLGLKLESTKGPVDVLVIDSAEHPTED